jgi:hypothetical protein
MAVEFRRSIEPDPRELPVGCANFIRLRLARPFKTFVGHRTIFGRRFHGTASKVRAANSAETTTPRHAKPAISKKPPPSRIEQFP